MALIVDQASGAALWAFAGLKVPIHNPLFAAGDLDQ